MSTKTRRRWTDSEFEKELKVISDSIGHFPSHTELRDMSRGDLANQITKRGGSLFWSQKLGIPRLRSDCDTGWKGEEEAARRLVELGFTVEVRSVLKSPFDLMVDGLLRVDVKTARLNQYGYSRGWFYRIGKIPQSDLILFWQLDTGDFFAIPWFLCPQTNVTITENGGKYALFRNNVELLREMIHARQQERDRLQNV